MKPNKILLTLFAALLPTFAFADTDMISASGELGRHCDPAAVTVVVAYSVKEFDAMEMEINALVNSTDDPVLASYYRDLYRAPAPYKTMKFVRTPDPYLDAVNLALHGYVEPDSELVC